MFIKILLFLYTTIIFSYDSLYCETLNETKYSDHSKFISELPDNRFLHNLALIGSHNSAANREINSLRTQYLAVTKQLESGIRVLDIRLSLVGQEFIMVYGDAFLIYMFEDILREINEFMLKNSGELIILLMKIDHYGDYLPSNSHYCEVLDIYIEKWKHKKLMLIKDWSLLDDYVGEHRGHILLGHDDDSFGGCTTYLPCEIQNSWDTNLERKWRLIKDNHDKMFNAYYPYHSCYVNYLCSDNPVFFKNYTLTHYHNSDNFEKRLEATKNINQLMANYFRNPIVNLVIIMTDFPTQELLDNIINSNFY